MPTVLLLGYSLSDWSLIGYKPSFVGLSNFISLFTEDPQLWRALYVNVFFSVVAVSAEFGLGFGLALLMDREFPGRGLFRSLLILPMVMTPVVVGLTWRVLFSPTFGMINYFTSLLGIAPRAWVADAATALGAVIVVDIWQWTPFMFLMLTAGLQSLPQEPFEAAHVDGATKWQRFRYLVLPMLSPVIVIALLLRFIESFKTFDIIYMLTRGGPGTATQNLNIYTYYVGFDWLRPGYASAMAVVMLVLVIAITKVFIKVTSLDIGGGEG